MDYVIIVNDNGELKTVKADELTDHERDRLDYILNGVLDARSKQVGFLTDLAERLMHVPVRYGTDQGDVSELNRIAATL